MASVFSLESFGVIRLTTGTTISPATMAAAPALIEDSINGINMLTTVIPTPTMKLAHTPALVVPFQYSP